jgi:hypothetical protein
LKVFCGKGGVAAFNQLASNFVRPAMNGEEGFFLSWLNSNKGTKCDMANSAMACRCQETIPQWVTTRKSCQQELAQESPSLSSAQEAPTEKEIHDAVRQYQKTVREYITRQPYHPPRRPEPNHDRIQKPGISSI